MHPHKQLAGRHVSFFCAVVRADAVDKKYPGGLERFVEEEGGVAEGNIILRSAMSQAEINEWLDRMEDCFKLMVGEDIALGDQFHGEIEPCPGVMFIAPQKPMGSWRVRFDPSKGKPVSYAVLSSFQCVESGEVQSDDEAVKLFERQGPAISHATAKAAELSCLARLERIQALSMDGCYAPYIVWVLLIRLDCTAEAGGEVWEAIRPLLEADGGVRQEMLHQVLSFYGVTFGEMSEEPYSLDEVLDGLAGFLS